MHHPPSGRHGHGVRGRHQPARRPRRAALVPAVLVAFVSTLLACTGTAITSVTDTPTTAVLEARADSPALDDDTVALKLYFRTGSGQESMLEAVERIVPVSDDLPRAALAGLLEGPTGEDERSLDRPLPADTEMLDFSVRDDTAHVTLSYDVVDDAGTVGDSPRHEALALAALTNTLTEFPSIEQVELTVEDAQDPHSFWGGWGLPSVLVRDETVIAPAYDGDGLPDLARFRTERQTAGTIDAPPVRVANVRVRDRITYVRVVAEIVDATEEDLAATAFPPIKARSTADGLVLDVSDVVGIADVEVPGQPSDPVFGPLQVGVGPTEDTLRITVPLDSEREFYLHTLSAPTRIVLDVKK